MGRSRVPRNFVLAIALCSLLHGAVAQLKQIELNIVPDGHPVATSVSLDKVTCEFHCTALGAVNEEWVGSK